MIRSRFIRSFVLLFTVAAMGCSEGLPTGPAPAAPMAPAQAQDGLLSGLLGLVTGIVGSLLKVIEFQTDPNGIPVDAIKWNWRHDARSVAGIVGSDGGTLYLPNSDFSITFPAGALSAPTYISITSDGGDYVSYDMKPHGIKFAKPVIVTQSLRNTRVFGTPNALNAAGAYFPQDTIDLTNPKALEIETTHIFSNSRGEAEIETWQLNHFSRYMLASG